MPNQKKCPICSKNWQQGHGYWDPRIATCQRVILLNLYCRECGLYKLLSDLPMWISREFVVEYLERERNRDNYAFDNLCKVKNLVDAVDAYLGCQFNDTFIETSKAQTLLRSWKVLNRYLNSTGSSAFGVYLAECKSKPWYFSKGNEFYSLKCNECQEAWL